MKEFLTISYTVSQVAYLGSFLTRYPSGRGTHSVSHRPFQGHFQTTFPVAPFLMDTSSFSKESCSDERLKDS